MDGMYKFSGMMSIGIADDIIITDAFVNSIRYVFKTLFQPRGNITVIVPEQIIFWSNSEIPEDFQRKMMEIAQFLSMSYGLDYFKRFGYARFNELDPTYMDSVEKFLNESLGGRMYFMRHFDGIMNEIRFIYEEHYRSIADDVSFLIFNERGEIMQSYVHTPFIIREIIF